jgi:hypothetical protein
LGLKLGKFEADEVWREHSVTVFELHTTKRGLNPLLKDNHLPSSPQISMLHAIWYKSYLYLRVEHSWQRYEPDASQIESILCCSDATKEFYSHNQSTLWSNIVDHRTKIDVIKAPIRQGFF